MAISITKQAKDKIVCAVERMGKTVFRIIIRRGGCAGLKFSTTIDSEKDGDIIIYSEDLTVVTNAESIKYLEDVTISLSDDLSEDIVIRKNKSSSLCRCGNSFSPLLP